MPECSVLPHLCSPWTSGNTGFLAKFFPVRPSTSGMSCASKGTVFFGHIFWATPHTCVGGPRPNAHSSLLTRDPCSGSKSLLRHAPPPHSCTPGGGGPPVTSPSVSPLPGVEKLMLARVVPERKKRKVKGFRVKCHKGGRASRMVIDLLLT